MALPVYKTRGISYADLPRPSTANLEEGIKTYQTINSKLDTLMSFVKQQGKSIREAEAQRDALNTPITEETLRQSMDSSGEVKGFLGAMAGGSYYDQAFRKAQGVMLSNELEIRGRQTISDIQAAAILGERRDQFGNVQEFTPDMAMQELQDLRDGYTAVVRGLDAEAGMKLRATMHIEANKAYQEIVKQKVAEFHANGEKNLQQFVSEDQNRLRDIYMAKPGDNSVFNWLPDSQRFETHEERATRILNPLYGSAAALPGKRSVAWQEKIQKANMAAMKNSFIERAINGVGGESVSSMLGKIAKDDMGEYNTLWNKLNFDEKMEVRKALIDRATEAEKARKAAAKVDSAGLEKSSAQLVKMVTLAGTDADFPALTPTSRQQMYDAMAAMNEIGDKEYFSKAYMEKVLSGEEQAGIMSPVEEADYKFQIRKGELDDKGIRGLLTGGKIDGKDYLTLMERLRIDAPKNTAKAIKDLRADGEGAMGKQLWNYKWGSKAISRFNELLDNDPNMRASDAKEQALQEILGQREKELSTAKHNSWVSLIKQGRRLWKDEYKNKSATTIADQIMSGAIDISDLYDDAENSAAIGNMQKIMDKARELGYIR